MKTTQFLANVKLWQGLFFSFLLLVSLNLNSQNVAYGHPQNYEAFNYQNKGIEHSQIGVGYSQDHSKDDR